MYMLLSNKQWERLANLSQDQVIDILGETPDPEELESLTEFLSVLADPRSRASAHEQFPVWTKALGEAMVRGIISKL